MQVEHYQIMLECLDVLGDLIIHDAVNREPKPFLDTGFLQGSFFKVVTRRPPLINNPPGQGMLLAPPVESMKELELRVGFLALYANRLHDSDYKPRDWKYRDGKKVPKVASMDGRGPYWLSSKLEKYSNSVYIPLLQKLFNKRLKNA